MSGSYLMKSSGSEAIEKVKKESWATNGTQSPPLSHPSDTPDNEDMNEVINENVDLIVMLPDGSQKQLSVEPSIQMMDLLINLTASNKLNPTSHSLVVRTLNSWKQIDVMANKTIGQLAGEDRRMLVQIIQRNSEEKSNTKFVAQTFEMTYRFTVNLPHNQKKVLRISPKLNLSDVRQILSKEKSYDQYIFQLPGNTKEYIDDLTIVGDLKTSEINFVSTAMIDAASSHSMPNLAFAGAKAVGEPLDWKGYSSSIGDKRSKWGFLAVFSKKDRKPKLTQATEIEDLKTSQSNKLEKVNTQNVQMHSKSMFVDSGKVGHFNLSKSTGAIQVHHEKDRNKYRTNAGSSFLSVSETAVHVKTDYSKQEIPREKRQEVPVVQRQEVQAVQRQEVPIEKIQEVLAVKKCVHEGEPKKSQKKRAAPPPPQFKKSFSLPQNVPVEIEINHKVEQAVVEDFSGMRVPANTIHSQNSSDSSGYHEFTLSGAESPDTNKVDNLQTTLDTTSIDSAEHFNGDSEIRDISLKHKWAAAKALANTCQISLGVDKPVPSRRKNKSAPLPPPGMSDEDFAAVQAMEEVTSKFTTEDSDDEANDKLQMIEDDFVQSENFDVVLAHHQQDISEEVHHEHDLVLEADHRMHPAMFFAPPPPTEPPPEDSLPVDLNSVIHQVHTTDIGVGEGTATDSIKDSPEIHQRHLDSSSSNSSLNTIEDLSLAFKQTIEMGEEALGFYSDVDNGDNSQEELQKAMPDFKEQIMKLSLEGGDEDIESNRTQSSEQVTDCDSSIIVHDPETATRHEFPLQSSSVSECITESSEITYEFKIDSVPPDFQNEDFEEESNVVVEYYVIPQATIDTESPKIVDLDIHKEHKASLPSKEEDKYHQETPINKSNPKDGSAQVETSMNKYIQNENLTCQETPVNKSIYKPVSSFADSPLSTPLKRSLSKDALSYLDEPMDKCIPKDTLISQEEPMDKSIPKDTLSYLDEPLIKSIPKDTIGCPEVPEKKGMPKNKLSYQEVTMSKYMPEDTVGNQAAPLNKNIPTKSLPKTKTFREIIVNNPINNAAENEEFIISLDELSHVDFRAYNTNEQKENRHDFNGNIPKVNYRLEFCSSLNKDKDDVTVNMPVVINKNISVANNKDKDNMTESTSVANNKDKDNVIENTLVVNQESMLFDDKRKLSLSDSNVKSMCSEISFSPDSEGEVEHVLEDKSISQIALPATRTLVTISQNMDHEGGTESKQIYASSTTLVLSQPNTNTSPLLSSQKDEASLHKNDSLESANLMQSQYQQMQDQFIVWQKQLTQNQRLLDASACHIPELEEQSNLQLKQLQLQIQMQQQMLIQLQQSMQTLAMQNSLASQHQSAPTQTITRPFFFFQELMQPRHIPPTNVNLFVNEKFRSPSPTQDIAQKVKVLNKADVPIAPFTPPVVNSKSFKLDAKYTNANVKKYEHEIDPHEQLMLDIRNTGKANLKKVPVKKVNWHKH